MSENDTTEPVPSEPNPGKNPGGGLKMHQLNEAAAKVAESATKSFNKSVERAAVIVETKVTTTTTTTTTTTPAPAQPSTPNQGKDPGTGTRDSSKPK